MALWQWAQCHWLMDSEIKRHWLNQVTRTRKAIHLFQSKQKKLEEEEEEQAEEKEKARYFGWRLRWRRLWESAGGVFRLEAPPPPSHHFYAHDVLTNNTVEEPTPSIRHHVEAHSFLIGPTPSVLTSNWDAGKSPLDLTHRHLGFSFVLTP